MLAFFGLQDLAGLPLPALFSIFTAWSSIKLRLTSPHTPDCLLSLSLLMLSPAWNATPPSSLIHLYPQHPAWGHTQGSFLVNVCSTCPPPPPDSTGCCWRQRGEVRTERTWNPSPWSSGERPSWSQHRIPQEMARIRFSGELS